MSGENRNLDYQIVLQSIIAAARKGGEDAIAGQNDLMTEGLVAAYYDVLDVAKEQAEILGVPLEDIGLDGYDPDSLLSRRPAVSQRK